MSRHSLAALLLLAVACDAAPDGSVPACEGPECGPRTGKGDGWGDELDPQRIAADLDRHASTLPSSGRSRLALWTDDTYAVHRGAGLDRWASPTTLSPLEKYDALTTESWSPRSAHHDLGPMRMCGPQAQREYGAYVETLGPAARYQASALGRAVMFDGVDNDSDGAIDECAVGPTGDFDGLASTDSLAAGLAAAALFEPEPLAPVSTGGQKLEVSDIKALLATAYLATEVVPIGGPCSGRSVAPNEAECRGLDAGDFHLAVTGVVGARSLPLLENTQGTTRTIVSYEISKMARIEAPAAVRLARDASVAITPRASDSSFYEVEMRTEHLAQIAPSTRAHGTSGQVEAVARHYLIELDGELNLIGGTWLDENAAPELLWLPRRVLSLEGTEREEAIARGRNPHVDLDRVRDLLAESRSAENPALIDADGDGHCAAGADLNRNGHCADEGEAISPGADCAEGDGAISPAAREDCANEVDDDCDGAIDAADDSCAALIDRDGDGFCAEGEDLDHDGRCLGEEESNGRRDCAEGDAAVRPDASESCTDGKDNDCNGEIDAADDACATDRDSDGDGYCPNGRDLNGDDRCRGAMEAMGPGDCDETSATINPGVVELCDDARDNDCDGDADADDMTCELVGDRDGDGYCREGRDHNRDGDCLDDGEAGDEFDCDETDAMVHHGAWEICGDRIDNDCDGLADTSERECVPAEQVDHDRDGYCARGRDLNHDGDCADSSESTILTDCADEDPGTGPFAPETCGDGLDNDCSGSPDDTVECRGMADIAPELEAKVAGGGCSVTPGIPPAPSTTLLHAGFLALMFAGARWLARVLNSKRARAL